MLRLLNEPVLHAQFHIRQAKGAGAHSGRSIDWLVRWHDGPKRQDCMKLDIGDGSPVEFKCRSDRVNLHWSAAHAPKDIGFVMPQIYRRRIIGLEWRSSLRPQP